jgi:hypothetical protein
MSGEIRSIYMPYCLILNPSGKYTITNRNYKPLGMWAQFVNYEDYSVEITGLGPATITKLSWDANPNPKQIFLYNDGCVPTANKKSMDAYLARLAILASLKIK